MLRILKSKISKIKGIKVLIKGRLNNRPRASSWSLVVGKVPLQTINAEISYNQKIVYTKNGTLGIKVWVSENTL
jgi:small subunit ribosomal protein S3